MVIYSVNNGLLEKKKSGLQLVHSVPGRVDLQYVVYYQNGQSSPAPSGNLSVLRTWPDSYDTFV